VHDELVFDVYTPELADMKQLVEQKMKNALPGLIVPKPGCYHVEMLQDTADPRHCFTYSIWKDQESLDLYRKSDLFGEVWPKTKLLFDDKPEAWSLELQGIGISPADLHLHQY